MPDEIFWNDRWKNNQIGFHLDAPHKSLVEFIHLFSPHKKVFVPLCGKSRDMIFLRQHNLEVVGAEFSELAIKDFIKENNLNMQKIEMGELNLYQGDGFKIYQGDLFKLSKTHLEGITCCYDRASMVALNHEERLRYAQFLIYVCSDLQFILSPLLDYGAIQDGGPPFSVTSIEINQLYEKFFSLEILQSTEVPLRESFKLLGATYEKEITWLFKKKN